GWLAAGPRRPDRLVHPIDMNGLRRLPAMLDEILRPPAPAGPVAASEEARRRRRIFSKRAPLAGSVPA
ncbi:MAG: hypothetical protein QOJ21_3965, partial [Solirubrobacteraceae bacterium]|nr:hypothetical protein [Solirubrobacteraceae bacterium]